jgi:hypothetical protein
VAVGVYGRRERLGLPGQDPQPGPKCEHLIDFPHERPGPADVGEGDVGADELDPGLDGHVGLRVRQQGPQPLSAGEFAPRRHDIAPVQGHAGLRRADASVLHPGLIQHRARLAGLPPGLPRPVSRRRPGRGTFFTHGHLTVNVYGGGTPDGLRHTAQPAGFPEPQTALLLPGVDCGGCR